MITQFGPILSQLNQYYALLQVRYSLRYRQYSIYNVFFSIYLDGDVYEDIPDITRTACTLKYMTHPLIYLNGWP